MPENKLDLAQITSIQVADAASDADPHTLEEKRHDEKRKLLELAGIEQDMTERKKYAFRVFLVSVGWIAAILVLLICDGFSWHFHLSDAVLLAAIGSGTTNILGIFYIVVRYLFPKRYISPNLSVAKPHPQWNVLIIRS